MKSDVVYDVPRDVAPHDDDPPARHAIIADPRNDQTLIILQLHVAMQMFHNKLVDYMRACRVPRAAVFESARRLARWHYQWMVTHEFLPAIVGKAMADSVYKEVTHQGADHQHQVLQADEPARGAPSSRSSSRWPHTASATASPGPATPSGTSSRPPAPAGHSWRSVPSSVPLFEARPTDNNLNGHRECRLG